MDTEKKNDFKSIKLRKREQKLIKQLREEIQIKAEILNDNAIIRLALENMIVKKDCGL